MSYREMTRQVNINDYYTTTYLYTEMTSYLHVIISYRMPTTDKLMQKRTEVKR